MSASGVFTRMKRVTFVKKEASEVGDGTAWPMLATLDQVAEIMYRVRDAWFTSGSTVSSYVVEDPYADPPTSITHTVTTAVQGTPIAQLVNSINTRNNPFGTNYEYARAYHVSESIPAKFDSYFGEEYSLYGYDTFRDCNSEIGIWYPDYGILGGGIIGYYYPGNLDTGFRCGFSHNVGSFASYFGLDPSPSGFYKVTTTDEYDGGSSVTGAGAWVIFTGEVAYVGDSPTSPTAQLYVGLKIGCEGGSFYGVNTSSDYFSGVPSYDTGANFVLGLAGGDSVSCKLYSPDTYDSVSNFVLQAQEWWPYAKAGGPVWNSATGAKL